MLGEPGEYDDPLGWERDCAERAIEAAGDVRVLVIGKSLASVLPVRSPNATFPRFGSPRC